MRFAFEAVDASGRREHGELAATDERAALKALAARGLTALSLTPQADTPVARPSQRIGGADRALAVRQLSGLIDGGVTLPAALQSVANSSAQPAVAAEIEGVRFDDRITLAGHELVLNGTGLRAAGWFKAYVVGLYLPKMARSTEQVVSQAGPKRVRLVLLTDGPAVELAKGFDKRVKANSSPAEIEALSARLTRMFELMESTGKVKKGDAVDLDFDPARGTTLALNGKPRGEPIAGNDFYVGVLRSFVGEHPYHRKLKAGLLGLPIPD